MRKNVSWEKEVNHPMDNKATMCFTWMLPSKDYDSRFLVILLSFLVCDFQTLNIYASITLTNWNDFHEVKWIILSNFFNLSNMTLKLSKCIWYCVSNKDLILLIIKLIVKTHLVIWFRLMWIHFIYFSMIRWNIIIHIESALKPSLSVFEMTLERPETWLHSIVK